MYFSSVRAYLGFVFFWCLLLGIFNNSSSQAASLGEAPIHFSGDKQIWDRKANRVELIGHAAVNQPTESLTADHILLDLNSRTLDAQGNCTYVATGTAIWGEEMHFNLDTRTGTIIGGQVSSDAFTLRGERINKLGDGRYQTHWGDYTTCRDCISTWSLHSEDVDMQTEGYAKLSNVVVKIKEAPTAWVPYLMVPMKTQRQSGFLFPPFSFGGIYGTTIVLPFFWAINRSSDMTFALGQYTERGWRGQWEGRYVLNPKSAGTANIYFIRDSKFEESKNRWGLDLIQTQGLPWGIDAKLKIKEVGDNLYPWEFPADVKSGSEAFLPSSLVLSKSAADFSAYVSATRYRNLLNSAPGSTYGQKKQFDNRTVQSLPAAGLIFNDRPLIGDSIWGGVNFGFNHFTRGAGPFDYDNSHVPFGTTPSADDQPIPGIDPIRKATRVSMTPSIYTTFRPFDVFSIVPSLQYRSYFYDFGNQIPSLYRSYLLFQTDLSIQWERIFEFDDDIEIPKAKHLIRPLLTYSFIPPFSIREDQSHPFVNQINYAQSQEMSGYNFDNNDIVPISSSIGSANYFVPLGHSMAYGLTSQWIRRREKFKGDIPSYQPAVEVSAGQAINFMELNKERKADQPPQYLTRFFGLMNLRFDHISSTTNYYYYTDRPAHPSRHTIATNVSYIMERSFHQRILAYDRSFTLGYSFNRISGAQISSLSAGVNYSISDYIMPFGTIAYGFLPFGKYQGASLGLTLQSPSHCWKFTGISTYVPAQGLNYTVDFSLNLTGGGFGGVTEIANTANNSMAN